MDWLGIAGGANCTDAMLEWYVIYNMLHDNSDGDTLACFFSNTFMVATVFLNSGPFVK